MPDVREINPLTPQPAVVVTVLNDGDDGFFEFIGGGLHDGRRLGHQVQHRRGETSDGDPSGTHGFDGRHPIRACQQLIHHDVDVVHEGAHLAVGHRLGADVFDLSRIVELPKYRVHELGALDRGGAFARDVQHPGLCAFQERGIGSPGVDVQAHSQPRAALQVGRRGPSRHAIPHPPRDTWPISR